MRREPKRIVQDPGLRPVVVGLLLSWPLFSLARLAGIDPVASGLPWLSALAAIGLVFRQSAENIAFGPANGLTLVRFGCVLLLVVAAATGTPSAGSWSLFGIAVLALLLDAVDGRIARRFHCTSRFGARFDLETDAAFLFAVGLLLWTSGRTGCWVLVAGLLRPLFLVAGRLYAPLAAPLPPSRRRALACGLAATLLTAALLPSLAIPAAVLPAGLAVLILLWSFAVDSLLLLVRR